MAYVYQTYPRWVFAWGQPPRVVKTEQEHQTLSGDWALSQQEADAIHERQQELIANAAAERAARDRRLSSRARREKLAQERATEYHVPE